LGKEPTRAMARLSLKPRIRLTRRKVLTLFCLAMATFAFSQAWLNHIFQVEAAQVRGNQRVPADDVSRVSAVDGRSIFVIRPAAVAGQVRELPGVAEAVVHVRLPNQVIIDVAEYEPWVAWRVITDTIWLAADGITRVPVAGPPPAFALVDETGAAMDSLGHMKPYVFTGLKAFHAARPEIVQVYYGRLEGLYYRAPEGWTVYLGDTGKIGPKLALLQAIQAEPAIRSRKPEVIDLRIEGRAEIR
jgi:hypothetical protein